jgi:pSer/pThr/pTyr-binding forkhead associated (FHA) protein
MTNTKNIAGFLHVLHPPDLAGKIPFYYGTNIIGRSDAKATLVIKEISISQKHATLYAAPNRITLTDLGSKNGTKINGEDNLIARDKEVVVDESMIIYFADVKCKLEVAEQKKEVTGGGTVS